MIPCQRDLFDLPREIAYLNAAYMTPNLRSVTAAGEAGARRKARPWQLTPAHFFDESERARTLFADLLGTTADCVAIVPSASYGLATAAANLPLGRGERILVLHDQFPSNVYAWRRLAAERQAEIVTADEAGEGLTEAVLARLDEHVRIAALPHCRWTDGALLDLEAIGARCRANGTALVLDVTQSLGALPLDLARVRPAFLAAGGYKWLLGPYSLSWLYVAPEHWEGRPLEEGWIARAGSEDFSRLVAYRDAYQPGARRFDVGERSNFAVMPAALVALERLLDWGVEAINVTLAARNRAIAGQCRELLGLDAPPEDRRAGHFLGIGLPPGTPADLTRRLAARDVHVSVRGTRMRITPHLYNDDEDVGRLLAALAAELPGAR